VTPDTVLHRRRIAEEILGERALQANVWPESHDDTHKPWEWLALVTEQAGKAVGEIDDAPFVRSFRSAMLRTAAVILAAIEADDRRTGRDKSTAYGPYDDSRPAGQFQQASDYNKSLKEKSQ
jgi:hypothetical protein